MPSANADDDFTTAAAPLFKQFCFECHAGEKPESQLSLERLTAERSFATSFKSWQKVAAMLQQRKMPPKDATQPSDAQRQALISLVRGALRQAAEQQAADPGQIIMRRLTSAEYAYAIQDLTGLDLNLQRDFVSDAVGGEGFTNVGTVQFVQDSTLERYLEAAKKVAGHAVIGAGPLQFYHDPGKTGLELSAIHRIQEIYRQFGFRTASGEGGEPFGLDRYPRAFHAAWRYRHREKLGLGNRALAELAAEEGLASRFVEHVWLVLNAESSAFPTSEIIARWQKLPAPSGPDVELQQQVRASCEELYRLMFDWQTLLAKSVGDAEEAAVLDESSLTVTKSRAFTARILWPPEATAIHVQFSIASADPGRQATPVAIWRNPRIRFRKSFRRREEPQALTAVLSKENAASFAFGEHPRGGAVGSQDFVTVGAASRFFDMAIPEGARGAELLVEAELDLQHGEDCVVRCEISEGEDGAKRKAVAATLLADPDGTLFQSWKTGVLEFARLLPQVSHREAAPSDRDPIPPPFDNAYNTRERDYFHYKVKYHRDDRFLVEYLLDAAARKRLDEAWTDLLTSFEYHDILLRFVADKYKLELDGRSIAASDAGWFDQLPAEPGTYVKQLREDHESLQRTLAAAQPGHLVDALRFASRAWRRPLADDEKQQLLSFYDGLRKDSQLDHGQAIRALVTRILVAPNFLYRAERPVDRAGAAATLSDWELASRLSYFLWSSLPDDELARAAAAGELRDPEQLARQARRLLADPKARRLATEFFGQWFGFYQFDRYRGVDAERFPEFSDKLKAALYEEAVSFFEHIVRNDRPVNEVLFADYTFLNRDLAEHYGIDVGNSNATFTRVEGVNRVHRGGLLGLGAVLTVTSAPLRTSPVKRGDWILRRVLGSPVPPPPADAGSIAADDALADGLTVRGRLEAHRRNASCANCHSRFDPLGFALEQYDPLGRWRDSYRGGEAIDASAALSDGTQIAGPEGLRRYLKDEQQQFHRTLCTKLIGYALGRGELVSDGPLIDEMLENVAADGGRFSNLVVKIVTSPQFRYHHGRDLRPVEASNVAPARGKEDEHGDR